MLLRKKTVFSSFLLIAWLCVACDPTGPVDDAIAEAFANQKSDQIVVAQGLVNRILADDRKGIKHQRFIVLLPSGITVLIAHNIDLAPRVANLKVGDTVRFKGEYEWNPKGGVVHWTHHDPAGRHEEGWIEHMGQRYQ